MSKKSMGLSGAHDYGAGMRANAEKLMPEMCGSGHAKGGKAHKSKGPTSSMKPRAIPPQIAMGSIPGDGGAPSAIQSPTMPPDPNSAPPNMPGGMKTGGKPRHCAMGGAVAGVRKGSSTPDGKPKSPNIPSAKSKMATPRFRGKAGIGGR